MSTTLYISNKASRNKIISKNGSCVTLYPDPVIKLDPKNNII